MLKRQAEEGAKTEADVYKDAACVHTTPMSQGRPLTGTSEHAGSAWRCIIAAMHF